MWTVNEVGGSRRFTRSWGLGLRVWYACMFEVEDLFYINHYIWLLLRLSIHDWFK
jgi:hypothetical protein